MEGYRNYLGAIMLSKLKNRIVLVACWVLFLVTTGIIADTIGLLDTLITLIVPIAIGIVVYGVYAGTPRDEHTGRKMMTMRAKPVVGWIAFFTICHGLALLFFDTSNISVSYTGGVLVVAGIIYAGLCFFCRREPGSGEEQ